MRFVVYTLITVLALTAGAGAFVYMALPTDFVRNQIVGIVQDRTGRTLAVNGPVSVSFYPDVTVGLSDVTLSPPAGMPGEAFLTVRTLGLKVPFWPLLSQNLIIERFTLDQPVISFRTDKAGRRSWDFAPAANDSSAHNEPPLRGATAESATPGAATGATDTPASNPVASRARADALAGLQLGDVRITDGTLKFVDDRAGTAEQVTAVTLKLALASLKDPMKAEGSVTWSGDPITITTELAPAEGLITGAPVAASATIQSAKATGAFKGRLAISDATPLAGKLDLKTGSLRELLHWLRHPLPAGPGFGEATVAANISVTAKGLQATNATAVADGMTAKGSFAVDFKAAKPTLTADLTIDRLDLNTYLPKAPAGTSDAPDNSTKVAASAAAATAVKDASKPETVDTAAADSASGWSSAPIDVAALRSANADISLKLGSLLFQNIKVGQSAAVATLKDGTLRTRFNELALYGGKGTGTVTIDANKPAAKIESSFALKSVQVLPLLQDAAGLTRLAGKGNISFGFSGVGRSQRDIVKTLQGQGRMEVADGTLVGYDVPAMVHGLRNGSLTSLQDSPAAKTGFKSLTATSTMTNGVMATDDLSLISPALKMTGTGKADLPARSLDYTLKPSILAVADATDTTGSTDATELAPGLDLPVRVTGPWAHPKIALDLGAIAKNPDAAVNAVKQALGKIKGGDKVKDAVTKLANSKQGKALGDLLGGLLGKKPAQDAATGIGLQADPAQ